MAKSDVCICDCRRSEEGISIWFRTLVLQRQIHSTCWELIGNRPYSMWCHTQREPAHWKLHSPGKKIMKQHLVLRGTAMSCLFMLSCYLLTLHFITRRHTAWEGRLGEYLCSAQTHFPAVSYHTSPIIWPLCVLRTNCVLLGLANEIYPERDALGEDIID